MNEHTYLLKEGRWEISGSTIDVAGNPNIMIGYAIVTRGAEWTVEQEINEDQRTCVFVPLSEDTAATTFTGTDGIAGKLHGTLAFFEDVLLCSWRSDDGHYHASETFLFVDESHYEVRGALFLDSRHVSSWSLTYRAV